MPPKSLKVTARYASIGEKGIRIMCTMSDGTVWSCDANDKNWARELISDREAQKSLKESETPD